MDELPEILTCDKRDWYYFEKVFNAYTIKQEKAFLLDIFLNSLLEVSNKHRDEIKFEGIYFPRANMRNFVQFVEFYTKGKLLTGGINRVSFFRCNFLDFQMNYLLGKSVKHLSISGCKFQEDYSFFGLSCNDFTITNSQFYGRVYLSGKFFSFILRDNMMKESLSLSRCSFKNFTSIKNIYSLKNVDDYYYYNSLIRLSKRLREEMNFDGGKRNQLIDHFISQDGYLKSKNKTTVLKNIDEINNLSFFNQEFKFSITNSEIYDKFILSDMKLERLSLMGTNGIGQIDFTNTKFNTKNRLVLYDEKMITGLPYPLYLNELKRIYRHIKNSCEQKKDFELAGNALKSEMHFRLIELWNDHKFIDHFIIKIYECLCDYNLNYKRPLAIIIILFILSLPLYAISDLSFSSGLQTSFSATLPFVIKQPVEFYKNDYLFWVYSIHSVLNTILIALFILSLRKTIK